MGNKLREFIKKEFGIEAEEIFDYTPQQREELFDKCVDIELEELQYGLDNVTERCELACILQNILS